LIVGSAAIYFIHRSDSVYVACNHIVYTKNIYY